MPGILEELLGMRKQQQGALAQVPMIPGKQPMNQKPQGLTINDFMAQPQGQSNMAKVQEEMNNLEWYEKLARGWLIGQEGRDPYAQRFATARQLDKIARQNAQAKQQAKNNFHNYNLSQEQFSHRKKNDDRTHTLNEAMNEQRIRDSQSQNAYQNSMLGLKRQEIEADNAQALYEASLPDVKGESTFRGEFDKKVERQRLVGRSFDKLLTASKTPAGDLSMIFNYMKMLDPGVAVQEGDVANVRNAGSVPDKVRNIYNGLVKGDDLTPEQRSDFLQMANSLNIDAQSKYNAISSKYISWANDYGFDPSRIVTGYDYGSSYKEPQEKINQQPQNPYIQQNKDALNLLTPQALDFLNNRNK
jgi:hypothetical protein